MGLSSLLVGDIFLTEISLSLPYLDVKEIPLFLEREKMFLLVYYS